MNTRGRRIFSSSKHRQNQNPKKSKIPPFALSLSLARSRFPPTAPPLGQDLALAPRGGRKGRRRRRRSAKEKYPKKRDISKDFLKWKKMNSILKIRRVPRPISAPREKRVTPACRNSEANHEFCVRFERWAWSSSNETLKQRNEGGKWNQIFGSCGFLNGA